MKDRLLLLFHTLRHIPPRPLFFEAWRRFVPTAARARAVASARPPPYPGCRWSPRTAYLPPGAQGNAREDILAGRLTFLNETEQLGWPPDWTRVPDRHHWRLYLHYLEGVWVLSYEEGRALVRSWSAAHPLARGSVAWGAYPVALRLMNLCGAFWQKHAAALEADPAFRDELWALVWRHAEWLRSGIEFNVGGNHVLENCAALAVAGSCFSGGAAEGWLRRAFGILREEVPAQVLEDGLHLTRSPMYNARVLYVLLTLCNTGQPDLVALTEERAGRMTNALVSLLHPDGGVPLICDTNLTTYNAVPELAAYAARVLRGFAPAPPPAGGFVLPASTYLAHRRGGDFFIATGGPLGRNCIPGHAHGDIFSFEWTLDGARFITDSGLFEYKPTEWRRYCRSTAAHNTVEIDGADQWEFWDVFRVARQARPSAVRLDAREDGVGLQGRFDGYRRLPGRPTHERRMAYDAGRRAVEIVDRVTADADVTAVSRLHFHPDVRLVQQDDASWLAEREGTRVTIRAEGGVAKAGRSWYCPAFGSKQERAVLELTARGRDLTLTLRATAASTH